MNPILIPDTVAIFAYLVGKYGFKAMTEDVYAKQKNQA